ncbi:MAG: DUF2235 domain-containing protein [Gammaproteobacteria bacterium]
MKGGRTIIVGLDGTWNEPERQSDGSVTGTNVVKFMSALMKRGQPQHYESGAGTRAWELLPGGIYGYGLDKRILGAYRFLRRCYSDPAVPRDRNRLVIVGFSRGAYAARRLSGLIAHSGIPVNASDVDRGWAMYQNRDVPSAAAMKEQGRYFDVPVEMVGVWDTVKATNDADYNDNLLSRNVVAGYHAMAVDERRKFFPILRWKKEQRVREMWFSGSHSDVGGGCEEMDLSDVALMWMIHRAAAHGVKFKKSYIERHIKPKVPGKVHDAFTAMWKPYGASDRPITTRCTVHESVETQLRGSENYEPKNLPSKPNYVPG